MIKAYIPSDGTKGGHCEEDYNTPADFHEWGLDTVEVGESIASFSVALVELKDGTMISISPDRVKFIRK